MEGIDLCYTTIENMKTTYEQKIASDNTFDKIKDEIALDVLNEALERIDGCREELDVE